MKLGKHEFKHGLSLAPMAGYTDSAMRILSHRFGAEFSTTEMVSAKAVTFGDEKTFSLAAVREEEGPVALQIFGSEPDVMARAAEILTAKELKDGFVRPFAIDINMGCPVNKIFKNGEGSALMRDPGRIEKIVRAVSGAADLPVTVKIRAGIDGEHRNAVECAIAAEEGGAAMITVHGRTRIEFYSGKADREIIKDVKNSVHIPVIANGDVQSGEDALSMLRDTGADGIAVGRGAVGNPFIFSEIIAALEKREYTPPTLREKIAIAKEQLSLSVLDKGERIAVAEARKQIASYFSSFRGAAALRAGINRAVNKDEVYRLLEKFEETCEKTQGE